MLRKDKRKWIYKTDISLYLLRILDVRLFFPVCSSIFIDFGLFCLLCVLRDLLSCVRLIMQISEHIANHVGLASCIFQKLKDLVVDSINDTALNLVNEACWEFDICDSCDALQFF